MKNSPLKKAPPLEFPPNSRTVVAPQKTEVADSLFAGVGVAGFIVLSMIAAFSSHPLTYDEPSYLEPVALLPHGFGHFLRNYPVVTGVVHCVVQWWMAPLTHLTIPGVRLVNIAWLVLTFVFTAWLGTLINNERKFSVDCLWLMAIPPVWTVCGLALTEPPALALMALGLASVIRLTKSSPNARVEKLAFAVLGGIALGLSCLARQNLLPLLAVLPLLAWRRRKDAPYLGVAAVAVALVVMPIFYVWKGLIPSYLNWVQVSVFSMTHLFLALGYAGIFTVFLAPGWMRVQSKHVIPIVALVLTSAMVFPSPFPLFTSLAGKLPPAITGYYLIFGNFVAGLAGAVFLVATIERIRENLHDVEWTLLAVVMLLTLLSLGKVSYNFSGRYLVVLAPLMVTLTERYRRNSSKQVVLMLVGQAVGATTLLKLLNVF